MLMINGGKKSYRTNISVVLFKLNMYVIYPIVIFIKKKFEKIQIKILIFTLIVILV